MATKHPPDIQTLSKAELDILYSPSCWSKKLPPEAIVHHHLKVIRENTQKLRDEVKHTLDVAYGDGGPGETMDIYYPSQECTDSQSVVIWIHGGYWTDLSKDDYGFICLPFVKEGVTVAVVNFDNAPKGTMTTIVDQCRRACLHAARTFPDKRLYLVGHSAGAHLCACLLGTDWRALGQGVGQGVEFHGAALLSGIYDLEPIQRSYVNDPLNLTESEVREYSPQLLIDQIKANLHVNFRCFVAYGNQESPEFKRQSREFSEGLERVGVASSVWEVENEDHFTLIERTYEPAYSLSKRLVELVKA